MDKQRADVDSGAAVFERQCDELTARIEPAIDEHDRMVDELNRLRKKLETGVRCYSLEHAHTPTLFTDGGNKQTARRLS